MNVQLYVYDLSRGLARQLSRQFIGTHIEAVYHTSIVLNNVEYYFGYGLQQSYPGATHHGQPMEILQLGTTEIPLDVILDYLESLKDIYTPESYDLMLNNCNNFTHELSTFLVGKGIPEHITGLPQQFLDSPFGQMLRPQLEQAMRPITQAPNASTAHPPSQRAPQSATPSAPQPKAVHEVDSPSDLEALLASAAKTCAVIFFTSSTCAPCKLAYPTFHELAEEAGHRGVFVKVDINRAHQIASSYAVRATPTFMTFLKGKKEDEWTGANLAELRGKVRLLLQQAAYHPHHSLPLDGLLRSGATFVTFTKVPPLDKLIPKLGNLATDPAILAMASFISAPSDASTPLPSLPAFNAALRSALATLPPSSLFAAYDLLRLALTVPRLAPLYALPAHFSIIRAFLAHVSPPSTPDSVPYPLRLLALHLACNLFPVPALRAAALADPTVPGMLVALATASLLDGDHATARVAASGVAFDLAAANLRSRRERGAELIDTGLQTEVVAATVEAVRREAEEGGNREVARGLVAALGLWVYGAEDGGEVVEVVRVMGAGEAVEGMVGWLTEGKQDEVVEGVVRLMKSC